jgi:hypothetical protein
MHSKSRCEPIPTLAQSGFFLCFKNDRLKPVFFKKGVSMDITKEEDRYTFILDCLCEKVSKGELPCPTPELLTAALRKLFPNYNFPPGTGIAIHDGSKAYWYVDVETKVLPPSREVWEFRALLSGFIKDDELR